MATEYYRKLVIDGTSGSPDLESSLAQIMVENFELWKIKQRKYGTQNIAEIGLAGILKRAMADKGKRLENMILCGIAEDDEGSQDDAWRDFSIYGNIGLMVYKGLWPGVRKGEVLFSHVKHLFKLWLKEKFTR